MASNSPTVKPILTLTTYEALALMAHRVAVSERERVDMQATFLDAFGVDEEKKRLYTESDADKQARLEREKFDAAVAAAVKVQKDAQANDAAVKAAAEAQIQAEIAAPIPAPVNPAPVAATS